MKWSPIAVAAAVAVSGCTSISSNYTADMAKPKVQTITVCHGFDCRKKATVNLSVADNATLRGYMAGASSAEAERAAVRKAVQLYETRITQTIGVPDRAKSDITESGEIGQMDCIDESTNTRSLLLHLEGMGALHYHKVEWNVMRGLLIDGRYPHSTAILRDKATGRKWAVDSWYEPAGNAPDVLPLEKWMTRGVMGER